MKFRKIKHLKQKISNAYLNRFVNALDASMEKAKAHGPGYWVVVRNRVLGVWNGKELQQYGFYSTQDSIIKDMVNFYENPKNSCS